MKSRSVDTKTNAQIGARDAISSDGRVRTMTKIALMAAVLCILGPLSIPIGQVPISLTTLAIYFGVYLLGAKKGTVSVLIYILLGLVGLPVFSGFSGGPAKLFGVTGGYIFGYLFLAAISGCFVEFFEKNYLLQFAGMVLGTAVLYLFGTVWFLFLTKSTVVYAIGACVLPFLPGDLAKIILALIAGPMIRRRLIAAGLY